MSVRWRDQVRCMVRGDDPHPLVACALAVGTTTLAAVARGIIPSLGVGIVPFATFYASALLSGLFGGYRAGLLAIGLGAIVAEGVFVDESFSFSTITGEYLGRMVAFVAVSLLTVWGANYYRGLASRLRKEQDHRKLVVEELTHRLKNKITIVHVVLQQALREHPEIFETVHQRLRLLAATDDLILEAEGKGCCLNQIFNAELAPYGMTRFDLQGPQVRLPDKLAVILSLVAHELATNAAKYGALSMPQGRIVVSWLFEGKRLTMVWTEINGPRVEAPSRHGFGTRLVTRALATVGGSAEVDFKHAGFVCTMSCAVLEP